MWEGRRGVQVEERRAEAPTDALIRKTTRCPALCRRGYRQAARRGGISSRFGPWPGCCGNAQPPTTCLNRWTAATIGEHPPADLLPRPRLSRPNLFRPAQTLQDMHISLYVAMQHLALAPVTIHA